MKKLVIDTDLLLGHVIHSEAGKPSDLRRLMGSHFCYTTVFNAIEAFGVCRTAAEREAVESSMHAMKILGLNAKSGKNLGALFSSHTGKTGLHLLIAGVCRESRLPLVTGRKAKYRGVSGLKMLTPREVYKEGP